LRGTIEEQQHFISILKKNSISKETNSANNSIEANQKEISKNATQANHKEINPNLKDLSQNQITDQSKIKSIKLEPEQIAYNAAYKLIEDKNFSEATVAFKDFLWQHNNSKYAPNAIYWLGELYLTEHKFGVAADYFLQVVNKYKDHDKAPDALLKLGMLEIERENWQGAKDYFTQIKKDYSNSSRVHMADAKLQSLQRDGH